MSKVMDNILARRSVRFFKDQPVEQEKLEKIVEAAIWAPSGHNQQTWHFIMISNIEKIQELANAVRKATGSPASYNFYAPSAFFIVSGKRDNSNGPLDAGAAMENAFLAATDLGVASCWINQVRDACNDPDVRKLLTEMELPEDHDVWASCALGYGAREGIVPKRKENTVTFIK